MQQYQVLGTKCSYTDNAKLLQRCCCHNKTKEKKNDCKQGGNHCSTMHLQTLYPKRGRGLIRGVVEGGGVNTCLCMFQATCNMGRLRRKNKGQRKKGRKEAGHRPASDPESCDPSLLKGEDHYSSCTNSCDETLYPLSGLCDGKHVEPGLKPRHSPADEMEVTHKLSCLNFSVPQGVRSPPHLPLPMAASVGFDVVSDGEGCSELASATPLDLLPHLSDRGEGMEGVESHYRHARKRLSKRKTNRRAKKSRYINTRDTSFVKAHGTSVSTATPQQPLPVGVARTHSRGSGEGVACPDNNGMLRTRSVRRTKNTRLDEDPLAGCLSDTSVLDMDTPTFLYGPRGGNQMEGVETIPHPNGMEAALMCGDTVPVESELSETTSDR